MIIEDFCLAERENNSKRRYIVINKIQGKHYPCSPSVTDKEFRQHARNIRQYLEENSIPAEHAVVIGFAETAVAIGAYIARELGAFYVSTTREKLPDCFERISFEESHSHAVEHTLCVRDKRVFQNADCVVIADDEFTTGKTAVKLAKALEKYLPEGCPITAAAFIASEESRKCFSENGMLCFAEFGLDDVRESGEERRRVPDTELEPWYSTGEIGLNSVLDFRLGVDAGEYFAECERLCADLWEKLGGAELDDCEVSVIGTEELCLPPIILGKMLEERGALVSVQGITRSPMLPMDTADYSVKSRVKLKSLYDGERDVFLYNKFRGCNVTVVITDATSPAPEAVRELCGALDGFVRLVCWRGKSMRTSFKPEDCTLLLKDVTGLIEPMNAKTREPLIQSGVHYSELLPAEYTPSAEYIKQYERGLETWSQKTADAVASVAERLYADGKRVIVSLARAGTPIGALIVRYLKRKYGAGFVHYSISIIRGKGIDENALRYILARHSPDTIQFVDGWTGKGAIAGQLEEALEPYPELSPRLAVLADPAGVCGSLCGTREDIFIPCACLNAVVSGLFSRTVLRSDIISRYDFHGAVCFSELEDKDRTYEFIEAIEAKMNDNIVIDPPEKCEYGVGLAETKEIAKAFGVSDINLVKPSIGETTRVLLRRVPRLVLVDKLGSPFTAHIEELAAEKGVEVREYPLKCYHACGIIQMLGDV